jgi:hypothetical protein
MRHDSVEPVYALVVTGPHSDGRMRCQYQDHDIQQPNSTLSSFLRATSLWFTDCCPDFLCQPVAANFVTLQPHGQELPIVMHKGWLAILNDHAHPQKPFDEALLSRYINGIRLFWERQHMPLRALFDDQMKAFWVVEMARRVEPGHARLSDAVVQPYIRQCGGGRALSVSVRRLSRRSA